MPSIFEQFDVFSPTASGMTCFETRLGCLLDPPTSHIMHMIHSNHDIFDVSAKINFSVPFHKLFTTRLWQKLLDAEDYFFGLYFEDLTVRAIFV